MRHAYKDPSCAPLCGADSGEVFHAGVDCPKCLEIIKARTGEDGSCHLNSLDYLPWLHLYAQDGNHQEAWVVGTTDGLRALRDALTKALDSNETALVPATASDGEGYCVLVMPQSHKAFLEMATPYRYPFGDHQPGKTPFEAIDYEVYRNLLRPKDTDP